MENVKSFFESFKEFTWDIVGYLLPGAYALILLSVCVNKEFFIHPSFGKNTKELYPFIFISISYLLGHLVYGIACLKEGILGKCSYTNKIERQISSQKAFILSKQLISNALNAKGITDDLSIASVRDLRSIAMSFIPQHDHKIYTFTFRSEISNHTGNISIIVAAFGILFSFFKSIPYQVFKTDSNYCILYTCLICCYFLLRLTRNKFYEISVGLPFSIYTANAIK
ncbi:MAG: hypothetical protein V4561_04360 [Bacteroidota bacterium]